MASLTEIVSNKIDRGDGTISLKSVFDPEFANLVEGQAVELVGYHPDTTVGGGSGVVKSARHNGGTAISKTRARPTDWTDQAQLTAWFADSGSDDLCFVRSGYSFSVYDFGAIDNQLSSASINAALLHVREVYTGDHTSFLINETVKLTKADNSLSGNRVKLDAIAPFTGDAVLSINSDNPSGQIFNSSLYGLELDANEIPTIKYGLKGNWLHFANIDFVAANSVKGDSDNGVGFYFTAYGNSSEQFAMFNRVSRSTATYCSVGFQFGDTGKGDVNASSITECRAGGYTGAKIGIHMKDGYSNNIDNNDIESYAVGIKYNARRNVFKGNLCEQNLIDTQAEDATNSKAIFLANELNIVSSLEPANFIGDNDFSRNLRLNSVGESVIVDSNFTTKLYGSTFLGSTLVDSVESEGDTGKQKLSFIGGASVGDKARILINDKGQGLKGWYTFILKAKASAAGSIFIKLPNGVHSGYRYCSIKTGTADYLELLEINSNTFVAGTGRTGSLEVDEYRYYSGSVYFNTDERIEDLRISVQGSGVTFSVDFLGLFKGENCYLPNDNLTYETSVDISTLVSGGAAIVKQFPYPSEAVNMYVTALASNSDFTAHRSINRLPYAVTNGSTRVRVFWSDPNNFGYDSVTSSNSFDFINGRNDSRIDYFSRTADLTSFSNCYFKFEFLPI